VASMTANHPKPSAKNEQGETQMLLSVPKSAVPNPLKNVEGDFGQFTNFMKRLLAVPHSEIKAKLDAEKRAKARRKSTRTSASRASRAKD
jgi:hypothetical protein